jgi:putative transcriptional regulator
VDQTGLSGSLLIAMPQLQDPNFHRTVLLMVHHDETSSFGLVLNRSADLAISSLFESLDFEWRGDGDDPVSWGGPVELSSGWMLFSDLDPPVLLEDEDDITHVVPGLNFAGSMDIFRHVAADPPPRLRFFLGYAGWGPGQLEFEITQGAWLSAEASAETIFRVSAESMWDHVVRGLGIEPSTLVSTSGIH